MKSHQAVWQTEDLLLQNSNKYLPEVVLISEVFK